MLSIMLERPSSIWNTRKCDIIVAGENVIYIEGVGRKSTDLYFS